MHFKTILGAYASGMHKLDKIIIQIMTVSVVSSATNKMILHGIGKLLLMYPVLTFHKWSSECCIMQMCATLKKAEWLWLLLKSKNNNKIKLNKSTKYM